MSHTEVKKHVHYSKRLLLLLLMLYDMVVTFVLGGAFQHESGRCGGDHVLVTTGGISLVSPHRGEVRL